MDHAITVRDLVGAGVGFLILAGVFGWIVNRLASTPWWR